MTARSSSPRISPRPKTDLPATANVFRPSLTGWFAEYKARKGEAAATPKVGDSKK